MKNKKIDDITVLDIQITVSILSLFVLIFSVLLLYNQKLIIQEKKPLFKEDLALKLSLINRVIILLLILTFILANFFNFQIDLEEHPEQLKYDSLEIFASLLTLIVALISIYVGIKAIEENNLNLDIISEDIF